MDRNVVALRHDFDDSIDVGEVNFRVDALGVKVQGKIDQVNIACTLSVSEQTTLDAISTGKLCELGSRNSSPWEKVSWIKLEKHQFQIPLSLWGWRLMKIFSLSEILEQKCSTCVS